jgi:glycosyltransferase involved in cell wall biosynthesis
MLRAFEARHPVERIGPLRNAGIVPSYGKRLAFMAVGRRYLRDRNPSLLRGYARQVERRLAVSDCAAVLSPGSIPISYLSTDKPLAMWTDSTFAAMVDFYPEFSNLPACSVREGNAAEQSTLARCDLAIFSSDWAARSAVDYYDVDPRKVRVVPFGANITHSPTRADVERIVGARSRERCTLLFLGVDWSRKGGDTAVAVTRELNAAGLPTTLHVAGCEPPAETRASPHVTAHDFIGKDSPLGRERFAQLLRDAHLLILPTRADCTPLVFAEANASGVPCLSTKVGGTATVIRDGLNGRLFDVSAGPTVWRDYILQLWSDPDRYKELAMASFDEFSGRLNWPTACGAVADLLREACAS